MSFCLDEFLLSGAVMSLSQDRLLIAWGVPSADLNHQFPSFYCTDFFLKTAHPWIQYPHCMEATLDEFKECLGSIQLAATPDWTIHRPEQYKMAFDQLSKDLKAGRLDKGVPYLFAKTSSMMTPERLKSSLQKCATSLEKKTGYLYGQWDRENGILGITPEILFSHSMHAPKSIRTMAVAGTCHPSEDQEAFFHNEKQRYEHQLVVQGISESLASLGKVHVGDIQLLQLPRLIHLMTPIELELSGSFDFGALVKQLHPTPALGAFPKDEGQKWLASFEAHTPRRYYGAPLGFNHPAGGISRCFVAIRNVQWDCAGMRIGAGGGVVKQSTFENEWQEIQIKIQAIRDQLHL